MTGFLTLLAIYLVSGLGVRAIGRGFTPQPGDGTDRKGGVASQSARCSRIGLHVIERGGNAADAVS